MCDLKWAEIILTFSVGGVTLRALIAVVKNYFKLSGLLAVLVSIAICGAASSLYLAIVHGLTLSCLILIWGEVFTGTQIAYRATHTKEI